MNMQEKITTEKAALLNTIQQLVRIPSVESTPACDAPFGSAVKEALVYMLELGKKDGFLVKNVDNYGGHIEFPGETSEIVGITAHLDVVPEGDPEKWITPAFEPAIRDNCIFGRGTIDDKGPLACVYHAMKLLKESGYRPEKTIRLILGCDEETNWNGMRYYLEHEESPVCGFSPDGDFPLICAEKGLLYTKFSYHVPDTAGNGIVLLDFHGGTASNMVPDCAVFSLECGSDYEKISKAARAYAASHPEYPIEFLTENSRLTANISGISAHGMMPWEGLNAISIACALLAELLPKDHGAYPFFDFYQSCIGFDLKGERFGRDFADEASGALIVNTGLAAFEHGEISIIVNSRYPVTADIDEINNCLASLSASRHVKMEILEILEPLYCSPNAPLVQILLETYRHHSGDHDALPIISAGATYARATPNTLAFGPMFPGDDDVCHQTNEYISIDRLMTCLEIYTDVIPKLAGGTFEQT